MNKKIIITVILFIFSILYIKNAVFFFRENDSLMKIIKIKKDSYYIKPINTIITKHFIIPGINGRKINIKKSYNNMKGINEFKESLLAFDEIKPNKTIDNIYNKVIIFRPINNKICILTNLDNSYCYTEDLTINDSCIKEKKYTILITKISGNFLTNVKKNLRNGVIFYLDSISQDELNLTKKYILNNKYEIVNINKLINQ